MKTLLIPFSWLYGAVVRLRNLFYDTGVFRSIHPEKPFTIGVGNLSAGGTGKSPQVAFLAEELRTKYRTAILSRGYKRKTTGFRLATDSDTNLTIGDEPGMYQARFKKSVTVAVCEDRITGIEELKSLVPPPDVVILDDVYQHRKIRPSVNILITSYQHPFYKDSLLPAGYLREPASGKSRADVIIVSKCPATLSEKDKTIMRGKIKPSDSQLLLFSSYNYSGLLPVYQNKPSRTTADIVLFTGIADPSPLQEHLKEKYNLVKTFAFRDHHEFSIKDIETIAEYFNNIASSEKVLLTTEKDVVRLNSPALKARMRDLPLYVIRADVSFSEEDRNRLFNLIENRIHA